MWKFHFIIEQWRKFISLKHSSILTYLTQHAHHMKAAKISKSSQNFLRRITTWKKNEFRTALIPY